MSQQRPRGSRPSLPAPSTGTLGAVVAVVALVVGFLILRDVNNSGGGSTIDGSTNSSVPSTDPTGNSSTTTLPSTIGFATQVANASGVAGSAGKLTTQLQALSYVVQPAKNVAAGTAKRSKTGVFYKVGCEGSAQKIANALGGNVDIAAMPDPVPVEDGTIGDACVLVLLGTDLAGKDLPGVAGNGNLNTSSSSSSTVAGQ